MKLKMKSLLLCLPLVACGGGDDSGKTPVSREPDTDYSKLSLAKIEPGPLRQASASELSELIKNGLRVSLRENQSYGMMMRETAFLNTTSDAGKAGGNFSGTNVQVAGVDEADHVKYDGRYIYLATPLEYSETGTKTSLKIFATDLSSSSAEQISETALDTEQWGNASEIYLVGSSQNTTGVVTIRRSLNFQAFADKVQNNVNDGGKPQVVDAAEYARSAEIWPYTMENGIEISLYDVRTPTIPAKAWTMAIDGYLLGTRRIGNTLYLISSFVPSIPALDYSAETKEAKIANEELIAQTQVEKILPEYSINGGSPQLLTDSRGCMVPTNTEKSDGSLTLINITAINLASQQLLESTCVNSNVAGIYSSLNNLYLGGSGYSQWDNWKSYSVFHQFSLANGGVDYSATGSVEGVLGWGSPSFRMDEHNNLLRVITTNYGETGEPEHRLSVLQKVSGRSELSVIAQLPNKTRPDPLGKPREEIFGVRFHGNKAYVVTFERKDPFYVLDLANPIDPKIAGQLEIPGFSTYLHPVGDNYIFAIGNETNSEGFATHLKVSLYDIRNPASPAEISKHTLGSAFSWSNALYDHRALSFLQSSSDQLRITFPVSLYEEVKFPDYTSSRWLNESLYQFEINGLHSGTVSLNLVTNLVSENNLAQEYPLWTGNDRGFLHEETVYYVHGTKVIGAPWYPYEK